MPYVVVHAGAGSGSVSPPEGLEPIPDLGSCHCQYGPERVKSREPALAAGNIRRESGGVSADLRDPPTQPFRHMPGQNQLL